MFCTSVRDMPQQGARLLRFVARLDRDAVVRHRRRRPRRPASTASSPFGPLAVTVWPSTFAVTPFGTGTGFLANSRHRLYPFLDRLPRQKTRQSTSPPTFWLRASWSDMTPFGVDRIDTPRPSATRGMLLHRGIDAAARLRHPLDLADHRLAVEIFQLDLELRLAVELRLPNSRGCSPPPAARRARARAASTPASSTDGRLRICAFRMRVSMSPSGSFISISISSPARLHHAGDLARRCPSAAARCGSSSSLR